MLPIDEIINDGCLKVLPQIESNSIHLILSNILYGIGVDKWDVLHDNTNSAFLGTSPAQEKAGAIFKKRGNLLMDGLRLIGKYPNSTMIGV